MKNIQKLVFLFVAVSFAGLALLPSVSSSDKNRKQVSYHNRETQNTQKLSHELLSEVTLHGFLLWASMGFLMPIGILIIRMSYRVECGRRLKNIFYFHVIFQILSVLLATAAAAMSFKNFENSFSNSHQRIGLALYGLIWVPVLIALFRPQRGTKRRSIWYFAHWAFGTGVSTLGIINIYTGLQAYQKKTLRSSRLWTILFTVEISFIAVLYLLQDNWNYLQKQGVILDNEPAMPTGRVISPTANQKENRKEMNVP